MNYFKRSFLFLCFSWSMSLSALSQNYVLEWTDSSLAQSGTYATNVQVIKGFGLDLNQPFFAFQQPQKNKSGSVQLLNLKYEPVPLEEREKYTQLGIQFSSEFDIDAKVVSDAGKPLLSIYGFGIRNNKGILERLLSFDITIQPQTNFSTKDYAAHSILGTTTGSWYKIAVNRDGIYKLDKAFLSACGINTVQLNPQHLHIF